VIHKKNDAIFMGLEKEMQFPTYDMSKDDQGVIHKGSPKAGSLVTA
jgi:hypothetical protein